MLLITLPVIVFSFIGSYRKLSYLSMPALFITVAGLITLCTYSTKKIMIEYHNPAKDEI